MNKPANADNGRAVRWHRPAKGLWLAAAFASASLAAAPAAHALPVYIGLQQAGVNSGSITQLASGNGTVMLTGTSYGSFGVNFVSVIGAPNVAQPVLDSQSLNLSSSTAGTLKVYVTETGLSAPSGGSGLFSSSFTTNMLSGSIGSVTEATYVDAGNQIFGTTTPLSSHMFTTIGTNVGTATATLTGPFSETEVYTLVANGTGTVNSTIQMDPVPEPASITLLGVGLLGMLAFGGQRRRV